MIEGKTLLFILAFIVGIPTFIDVVKTWYIDIHAFAANFDIYRGMIVGVVGLIALSGLALKFISKGISEFYDMWQKIKPKKSINSQKK